MFKVVHILKFEIFGFTTNQLQKGKEQHILTLIFHLAFVKYVILLNNIFSSLSIEGER